MKATVRGKKNDIACMLALCMFLFVLYHLPSLAGEEKLKKQYKEAYEYLKEQPSSRIEVLKGPKVVEMGRGGKGKQWVARSRDFTFKITIKNAEKIDLGLKELVNKLQYVPRPYVRAFQIVSDENEDGVAVYADLNGAAAHGSKDYINIVPHAGVHVLTHEAGHTLQQYVTEHGVNVMKHWSQAIEKDDISVSEYGDHVDHEDLAEFAQVYAACYTRGKEALNSLRKQSPRRYALWEDLLFFSADQQKEKDKDRSQ